MIHRGRGLCQVGGALWTGRASGVGWAGPWAGWAGPRATEQSSCRNGKLGILGT